jgi:prepilin-type processing-associated H-X9-DG protein
MPDNTKTPKPRLLFLFFLLAFAVVVSAQNILAPGIALYPGNLGLQQNTITAIFSTKNGQMWVSTFGGLHRFNGHSFTHIPFPKKFQLPANDVIRSIIGSGDSLLIASETAIFSYRPASGRFTALLTRGKNTFKLLRLAAEELYFYDFAAGALKTIHLKKRTTTVLYADGHVRQIYDMTYVEGTLFLKTADKTILKVDINNGQKAEIVTDAPITQICAVANSGCVIATSEAVYLSTSAGLKKLHGIPPGGYFSSTYVLGADLFLQRQAGWYRYNLSANTQLFFSEKQLGVPDYLIGNTTAVYTDASGNLWMGKDGFGMLQINRLFWQFNNGLALKTRNTFVRCLAESHGKLWAGSQYLELLEMAGDTIIRHVLSQPKQQAAINSIDSLDANTLLLGTDVGLWKFSLSTKKFERLKGNGPESMIASVKKLGNKWLVYSLLELHLKVGHMEGSTFMVDAAYPMPDQVRCLQVVDNTTTLIALRSGGLLTLNSETGQVFRHAIFDKKQIVHIAKLENRWMFATASGILVTDNELHILEDEHASNLLIRTHCYAVLPFDEKDFWVSTNTGLVHGNQKHTQIFTARNGLQGDEFNGRCALQLRNGQLAFGGVNGVSIFSPNTIFADTVAANPYLQSATNAGQKIPAPQLQKGASAFGEGELNMHLHVEVTNYTISEKNELAIALLAKGRADTTWQNLGNTRDFYLTGLNANTYTLLAKAANADGRWGALVVLGTFRVTPIFYKTWWFITLLFLGSLGIAAYLIYLTAKRKETARQAEFLRLKALAEMRQQIADDIHDDLGAGLTKLALMADRLALKKPTEAPEIKPLGATARNLTKSLKEVIWATKPENDNLNALQSHLVTIVSEMLADTSIQLILDVDEAENEVEVSPMHRQHVFQFVREVVHNCIKHAQATTFYFSLKIKVNTVFIHLKDNGIGFSPDTIKEGNGSQSLRRRAKAIDAHFSVTSSPGGPTETKLEFIL